MRLRRAFRAGVAARGRPDRADRSARGSGSGGSVVERIGRRDEGIARSAAPRAGNSSGRRKPIGESPGTQIELSAARHPLFRTPAPAIAARVPAFERQDIADRLAAGRVRTPAPAARAPRGSSSLESSGSTLTGKLAFLAPDDARDPRRPASHSSGRGRAGARCPRQSARASSIGRRGNRSPSRAMQLGVAATAARRRCASKARTPSAAGLSPGYHLPWP